VNALFGHCFLTLEWSLMSRADSVTKTHLHHIQWRDDCLIIYFAHTKTDQEGLNMNEPWHIYANPLDPAVCPVLALGLVTPSFYWVTKFYFLVVSNTIAL